MVCQTRAAHETQTFVDFETGETVTPIEMIGWEFRGAVKDVNNKWVMEFDDPILPECGANEGELLSDYRKRQGLPGTETYAAHCHRWIDGRWQKVDPST